MKTFVIDLRLSHEPMSDSERPFIAERICELTPEAVEAIFWEHFRKQLSERDVDKVFCKAHEVGGIADVPKFVQWGKEAYEKATS